MLYMMGRSELGQEPAEITCAVLSDLGRLSAGESGHELCSAGCLHVCSRRILARCSCNDAGPSGKCTYEEGGKGLSFKGGSLHDRDRHNCRNRQNCPRSAKRLP